MLRSLNKMAWLLGANNQTILRKSLRRQSSRVPFLSAFFFSAGKGFELSDYDLMKKLSKILGTKYLKFNEEIEVMGDVKVIDEDGKFLGVYSLKDAKKKVYDMEKDLVLINDTVKPNIVKAMNYRDSLYEKFNKSFVKQTLATAKQKGRTKSIKLGTSITNADLKNKAKIALDLLKKARSIKIYICITDENEAIGRNIIYSFRDLVKEDLFPISEIVKKPAVEDKEEKEEVDEDAGKDILEMEFQKIEGQTGKVTNEDLRRIVNSYFAQTTRESILKDKREILNELYSEPIADQMKEEQRLAEGGKEYLEEEFEMEYQRKDKIMEDDIEQRAQLLMKEKSVDPEQLLSMIEELRKERGLVNNQALMETYMEEVDTKARFVTRLLKMIDLK